MNRVAVCKTKLLSAGYELTSGITKGELASLEAEIGRPLPYECKAVITEFEVDVSKPSPGYGSVVGEDEDLGEYQVLDIIPARQWVELTRRAQAEYDGYRESGTRDDHLEISGPALSYLFGDGRIVFSAAHGLFWAIDMCPGDGGNVGQILLIYPMYQSSRIVVVASDYLSFFEMYVDGLIL